MTGPPLFLAAVVALGLVVWAIFYVLGSPLNPAEAVVMVGLCGAIAYGLRAAFLRLVHHKKKAPGSHHAQAGPQLRAPGARAKTKTGGKAKKRRH